MAKNWERARDLARFGRRIAFQLAVGMVALVVIALGWWFLGRPEAGSPESMMAPHALPTVRAVTLTPRDVPLAPQYLGRTAAAERVEIRARVQGFLERRLFEEGTEVSEGQRLFEMEREPFEADVAVEEARVAAAKAQVYRARQQLNRFERARSEGAATETEVEEQETELRVAEASLALALAQLEKARLSLGYTLISSPINGLIGEALADVGSYVGAGDGGLLAVVEQIDPIDVTFSISEREMLRWQRELSEGTIVGPDAGSIPVQLLLSDGRPYSKSGRIDFVDVRIDPSTSTALVRAVVPNPDGVLRPGQFVQVLPQGFVRRSALVAPKEAILQDPTGATVFVIDDSGAAHARTIELGEWTTDGWVIRAGVTPGERIVTEGVLRVRSGALVHVLESDFDAAPSADTTTNTNDGDGASR